MASSVVAASRTLISTGIAATASSTVPRLSSYSVVTSSSRVTSYGTGLLTLSPRAAGAAGALRAQDFLASSQRNTRRSYRMPATTASASSSLRAFSAATETKGAIQVGEKLPESELSYLDKDSNVQTVKVSELTEGKKVVIFAVPGAYTPTCTQKHVPGFVAKADELKAKGVDTIACVSVNDVFVLNAWGESLGIGDKVLMLSDGLAKFTKALGVQIDMSDKPVGLGIRSRRYALLADNGVVKQLNLEEGGAFTVSGPDEILKALA